ncbi:MAG: LPXTG cell wall anchor domain-containing protein [Candidatus Nanopelagicaceae bacterium]|jgi:LPXTG-motif cell wall-anchored protein
MSEILTFAGTTAVALALILFFGKKRKRVSRYERTPHATSDWQKLDRGIDPTE